MAEPVQQERGDIDVRATAWVCAALAAMVVVAALVAWWTLRGAGGTTQPAPLVGAAPTQGYAEYLAAKRARLEGWGWVNREQGIAHIPVERAMALMAQGQ